MDYSMSYSPRFTSLTHIELTTLHPVYPKLTSFTLVYPLLLTWIIEEILNYGYQISSIFIGYKTFKQTTGTMIPQVYVGSIVI